MTEGLAALRPSRVLARDLLVLATAGTRARQLRSALTTLGIAVGIAAIVAVLGTAASTRADLLAQLDRLGTNHLEIRAGQSLTGGQATLPAQASARIARLETVRAAAAVTTLPGSVRRSPLLPLQRGGGITLVAADTSVATVTGATVAHGRWHDHASQRLPTVVLGATAANRLGIEDVDGRAVAVNDRLFTVIGILEPIPLYATLDSFAFIGYPAAQAWRVDVQLAPSTVYVTTEPGNMPTEAQLAATVNPTAPEQVAISNPSDALAARQVVDATLTRLLVGLGSVALLVGGLGVANVMVIGVIERRTEIGVRRALGATRRHIRTQFLLEALLLGVAGGMVGTSLGALATLAYARSQGIVFFLPPKVLALGLSAAMAVAIVSGLAPATRAARLPPVDAIRPA